MSNWGLDNLGVKQNFSAHVILLNLNKNWQLTWDYVDGRRSAEEYNLICKVIAQKESERMRP